MRPMLLGWALLAVAMAAGCASQLEPAKDMLGNVSAAMAETSADAAQAVPEQYAEVQRQVAELQARFDREDYTAVIAQGPAVLAAVHGLGQAAAAKKAAMAAALGRDWAQLASSLPDEFSAIEQRLDFLGANARAAAGIEVAAARTTLRSALSLWSKGQAAFAAGNLPEAVQTGHTAQEQADSLKSAIRLR